MPDAFRLLLALTLAAAAAACGGEGSSDGTSLERATAERLAAQSDAVADAIEANDGCAAAQRIAELRASLAASTVPEPIRREVEPLARRRFKCLPPPPVTPPSPAEVPTHEDDDEDGADGGEDVERGHGKAKGHGKGKAHGKHKKDTKRDHDGGEDDE